MSAEAKHSEAVSGPKVYQVISDVMADLAEIGIAKSHTNQQQRFAYRGIDDVYNVLSKVLTKHRLIVMPTVISRETDTRQTHSGAAIYLVVLKVEYEFIAAEDGSSYKITAYGEAMDMADKATSKAISMAYKYAMFQTFCIPIDVIDGDDTTPPDTLAAGYQVPKSQGSQKPGTARGAQGQQARNSKPAQQASRQQPQQPAQQAAQRPAAIETAQPLTTEELAALSLEIDDAAGEALKSLTHKVYNLHTKKQLSESHAKQLASVLAQKVMAEATAATIAGFERFIAAYQEAGLIDADTASIALSSTRSRLNISPTGAAS